MADEHGAVMAAAVDAHCTCARDDVEPRNGRCQRCGKLLRETFDTQAVNNVGVARHSPSAAYRSPIAPFEPSKSVAATAGLSVSEQGAEPEAALPTPLPSPQLVLSPVASAPALEPPAAPRSQHDWALEGQTYCDSFTVAADALERQAQDLAAQAGELRIEAARLRKSAKRFSQALLELSAIEPDAGSATPSPAIANATPDLQSPGHWSLKHGRCISCGTTDRPHVANGRCRPCDSAWRRAREASA